MLIGLLIGAWHYGDTHTYSTHMQTKARHTREFVCFTQGLGTVCVWKKGLGIKIFFNILVFKYLT